MSAPAYHLSLVYIDIGRSARVRYSLLVGQSKPTNWGTVDVLSERTLWTAPGQNLK